MKKRSDEKIFNYQLTYNKLEWIDDNTFKFNHNRCTIVTNIKIWLDGVLTVCNYKELDPNTLLISLNKNNHKFKNITLTVLSDLYTTFYNIYNKPDQQDYILFDNTTDCVNDSTELILKSSDGWVYTDVQFNFYNNNKLKVQLPSDITFPIQITVINNSIDKYPYL